MTQFSLGDGMKLSRHLCAFILSLSCIGFSWAQTAPAPKTVVIHAGHLLDVKTGKTLTSQTIIIQGDKISQVGGIRDQLLPKDATVIELPDATVLPGLIDAHTHVTFTTNFGYSRLAISVPREALTGARNARVTLEAGFTTIRNVGASGFTDVALRDAINAGETAVLRWEVVNAAEVRIEPGVGRVEAQGRFPVTPQATTTYRIFATAKGTFHRDVQVTVMR